MYLEDRQMHLDWRQMPLEDMRTYFISKARGRALEAHTHLEDKRLQGGQMQMPRQHRQLYLQHRRPPGRPEHQHHHHHHHYTRGPPQIIWGGGSVTLALGGG